MAIVPPILLKDSKRKKKKKKKREKEISESMVGFVMMGDRLGRSSAVKENKVQINVLGKTTDDRLTG